MPLYCYAQFGLLVCTFRRALWPARMQNKAAQCTLGSQGNLTATRSGACQLGSHLIIPATGHIENDPVLAILGPGFASQA
jgi:hypothetical protein